MIDDYLYILSHRKDFYTKLTGCNQIIMYPKMGRSLCYNRCMDINIIAIGKLKDKSEIAIFNEYRKMLSRFASVSVTEIPNSVYDEEEKVIHEESGKILSKIPRDSYVILCDLKGRMYSSEEFSALLSERMVKGDSRFTFIIGGSNGFDDDVRRAADMSISFSRMTFPHKLFRIMLIEQIYRAFKIMNNEPYHK